MKLIEFLGGTQRSPDEWSFAIPRELHGAFGGAFGGVVCAAACVSARAVAPGRVPNALDCRFVRGLGAGTATASTTVLHSGRTLSNVAVDIFDGDDRLCSRSTISLVDRGALSDHEGGTAMPERWIEHGDATPWPSVAPIISVLDSRIVGQDARGFATAIRVPWDVTPDSSAEAVCMAADMAVGAPLGANAPRGVATPNPDISLRFCGDVATPIVVGVGRFERAAGGVAAISIDVWSGANLVGVGVSTALLLSSR